MDWPVVLDKETIPVEVSTAGDSGDVGGCQRTGLPEFHVEYVGGPGPNDAGVEYESSDVCSWKIAGNGERITRIVGDDRRLGL